MKLHLLIFPLTMTTTTVGVKTGTSAEVMTPMVTTISPTNLLDSTLPELSFGRSSSQRFAFETVGVGAVLVEMPDTITSVSIGNASIRHASVVVDESSVAGTETVVTTPWYKDQRVLIAAAGGMFVGSAISR